MAPRRSEAKAQVPHLRLLTPRSLPGGKRRQHQRIVERHDGSFSRCGIDASLRLLSRGSPSMTVCQNQRGLEWRGSRRRHLRLPRRNELNRIDASLGWHSRGSPSMAVCQNQRCLHWRGSRRRHLRLSRRNGAESTRASAGTQEDRRRWQSARNNAVSIGEARVAGISDFHARTGLNRREPQLPLKRMAVDDRLPEPTRSRTARLAAPASPAFTPERS